MAWFIDTDSSNFSFVKFRMEPTCRELSPSVEYYQAHNLMHLYGRIWWSAIDIEDRFWPRKARLTTDRKLLPHWVGFCSFYGISEDFRRCVEYLEPGVHEFREVEVLRKDGSAFDKRYYAMNVRTMVCDAIDWERTTAPSREAHGIRIVRNPNTIMSAHTVAMRRRAIDGYHLWIPQEASPGACYCVSDALHELLVEHKLLRGIHSFQVSEV